MYAWSQQDLTCHIVNAQDDFFCIWIFRTLEPLKVYFMLIAFSGFLDCLPHIEGHFGSNLVQKDLSFERMTCTIHKPEGVFDPKDANTWQIFLDTLKTVATPFFFFKETILSSFSDLIFFSIQKSSSQLSVGIEQKSTKNKEAK